MANRFIRLVRELIQGEVRRTSFQPWEVNLLLDLQECRLVPSRRNEALQRYQRAVLRQLEKRELPPIRFSEFVGRRSKEPIPIRAPSAGQEDAPPIHP